jgi:tripartite-type tricarboxylate transporter receptor subunit TctC
MGVPMWGLATCALLLSTSGAGHAQTAAAAYSTYPSRSITMIVVNPPGSGADIVARLVGRKMSEALGQQIVIDNRPGASGIIAAGMTARASPDGYTLLMGSSSSQAINASIYTSLPFDPIKDFAPISMVASTPYLMVAHPSLAVSSVAELIAMARARPGQLNFAAGGVAVGSTLAGQLFTHTAGVNIVMVPYKGAPQATADVVGGQVQLAFSTVPTGIPLVNAGKLRALGVTGAKRLKTNPDIPTIAESGLPGFDVTTWFGILAPRGTPSGIVAILHRDAVAAVNDPHVADALAALGYDVSGTTPEQFDALIKSEIARWSKVVAAAGIQRLSINE